MVSHFRIATGRVLAANILPVSRTSTQATFTLAQRVQYISTTSIRCNPQDDSSSSSPGGKPSWLLRTSSSQATRKPPPPPPSASNAPNFFRSQTAASKSAANDQLYDATSHKFDLSKILANESELLRARYDRPAPELRTKPVLGRTVAVAGHLDLAGAVRRVNVMCAKNGIRRMERLQRFHERPGLKRKRLRSERWRARFKIGFNATVKRVQELKKQGW